MPYRPQTLNRRIPRAAEVRGTAHQRGYDGDWQRLSRAYRREFPFCRHCLDSGKATNGDLVDHIIPLDQGGERLDESNLQTLCRSCHAKKTVKDKK